MTLAVPPPGAASRPRRVFVVEDHPFQREALTVMLRAAGIQEIGQAANGRAALTALDGTGGDPVDLILCDLEMPEMDGIEFLRMLAERRLARSVIIISGRETEILQSAEAMARAYGLWVRGWLKKPPTTDALHRLLARGRDADGPSGSRAPEQVDGERLRRALEKGEFQAEFQPKVSLATGEVIGVEALARWRPPASAVVPPDVFVPAVVREGLVMPLTECVLDAACAALRAWSASGLEPRVAVNLSLAGLSDVLTADRLVAQVRAHGIATERITFEVTETELNSNLAAVLDVLTRLRLSGFGLSIDDFGIGYSSLSQLSKMPFSELKIDRSFVRDCPRAPRLATIVQASIDLAHRLKMRAVAEGIETADEWRFLRANGCDKGQGYYIARPMAAQDFPGWVSRWRPPRN